MYGSILMAVTCRPQDFRIVPTLLAMMPLPMPEMTPPVTRMYFIILLWCLGIDDRFKSKNVTRSDPERLLLGLLLKVSEALINRVMGETRESQRRDKGFEGTETIESGPRPERKRRNVSAFSQLAPVTSLDMVAGTR
ncbi:hypothetical protein EYF80_003586 [Liparis tanakae]|uniref:Uncharacterized protein n=1 Tax=Liparis tanakae TaxID=230148 RepID=A0A4Z2J7K8_9TELE|nr:hypothetical protein EYF80_003586 [Liparis tanakae]